MELSHVRCYPSPPCLSLTLAENEPIMDMGVYFYANLSGVGSFLGFELHSTGSLSVPRPVPLCFGDCSSVCDSEAHCCTPKDSRVHPRLSTAGLSKQMRWGV